MLLVSLLAAQTLEAEPLRLVVIGDSLSAEYDSLTGAAGVDDPTEYAAVTVPGWESMSWTEVVGRLRTNEVSLGGYGTDLLEWGLLRFSGYEYNFAVPGFTAAQFEQVVDSSLFSDPIFLLYKQQLADTLKNQADAAVVWLGGNEFRGNYAPLSEGGDPEPLLNKLQSDLTAVVDFVLAQKPGIKLVMVNLPDLGAAPSKQMEQPDPLKRARVTAATVLANQRIAALAAARGLPVADVYEETRRLVDGETVWIGPVDLKPGTEPDNHPRYEFTRDGLHPNTCLQAIIARRILDTFNQAYATGIPLPTDDEILNLIGITPPQTLVDWVNTNSLSPNSLGLDNDGDHLANLTEFAFRLDPKAPSPSPLIANQEGASCSVHYHPAADRLATVDVQPQWSTDLGTWASVPESNVVTGASGEVTVNMPIDEGSRFVRLKLSVRTTP